MDKITQADLEAIPNFRGNVESKTALRKTPDLQVGDVFYVTSVQKVYGVTRLDTPVPELAEVAVVATQSAGITMYELSKTLAEQVPEIDLNDESVRRNVLDILGTYFDEAEAYNFHFLQGGGEFRYFTLFRKENLTEETSLFGPSEVLSVLSELGPLLSISPDYALYEDDEAKIGVLEIWVRYKDSPELIYLYPFDRAIVDI